MAVLWLLQCVLGGCAAAEGTRAEASNVPSAIAPDPLADPELPIEWRASPKGDYQVALPDARGWNGERPSGVWFTLTHAASSSLLRFGLWRSLRTTSLEDCARMAEAAAPEALKGDLAFGTSAYSPLERSRIHTPAGFQGELALEVASENGSARARARLLSVKPGACFLGLFVTEARGTGATRSVIERATVIADHTLRVVKQPTIEDRVRPDAL